MLHLNLLYYAIIARNQNSNRGAMWCHYHVFFPSVNHVDTKQLKYLAY